MIVQDLLLACDLLDGSYEFFECIDNVTSTNATEWPSGNETDSNTEFKGALIHACGFDAEVEPPSLEDSGRCAKACKSSRAFIMEHIKDLKIGSALAAYLQRRANMTSSDDGRAEREVGDGVSAGRTRSE